MEVLKKIFNKYIMTEKYKTVCGIKLAIPITRKQYLRYYGKLTRETLPRVECKYCKRMVLNLNNHEYTSKECRIKKKAELNSTIIKPDNFIVDFSM